MENLFKITEKNGEEWVELQGDLKGLFLYFGTTPSNEKITVGSWDSYHYTLHFGTKSNVIDIHRKNEKTGEYHTLFELGYFSLMRLVITIKNIILPEALDLIRNSINIGKLGRHDCVLIPGDATAISPDDFLKIRKNGRHTRLRNELKFTAICNAIVLPSYAPKRTESFYLVYSFKRATMKFEGIIFRNSFCPQSHYFIWISKSEMNGFIRRFTSLIVDSISTVDFYRKEELMSKFRKLIIQRYGENHGMNI
ncbi:hypothetical protein [uncultured Roseivirga sp.]|mgnify:CR=1 FL=1|uniref:hypothetical protein n=1 Tax=uncultured Roseivirga sp. TaxID=543088 RepID=UPI000D7A7D45|nr:hypothetical protein [uncultured Roseivirga sp.]PWL31740.1 MAG: hypothetical protein DCO95_00715 [Roseivirga sp. XM-24bin3]